MFKEHSWKKSLLIRLKISEIRYGLWEKELENKASEVINALKKAQRPVFVAGHGIRIAQSQNFFINLIEKMEIPTVTTFNGF